MLKQNEKGIKKQNENGKKEKKRVQNREQKRGQNRGQTAVEYLLLIAAMIAFVALITYIIKTQVLR